MIQTSIVIVAYNYYELLKTCVESAISLSSEDREIIIIDNHSPDIKTAKFLDYLEDAKVPNLKIIDAGSNIGCHAGFALGFNYAEGDYLVKLDDDTEIKTKNWDKKMIKVFEKNPDVAFLAPHSNVEQGGLVVKHDGFDEKAEGVLGFSLMMIPRKNYELFGATLDTLSTQYLNKETRLYGGEELFLATKAKQFNMRYGYAPNVEIFHMDNEHRPVCYVLWKEYYGLWGKTNKEYNDFIKDKKELDDAFSNWLRDQNQWKRDRATSYFNGDTTNYLFY